MDPYFDPISTEWYSMTTPNSKFEWLLESDHQTIKFDLEKVINNNGNM